MTRSEWRLSEAAKRSGTSVATLRLLASDGAVPVVRRPNGLVRVTVDDVPTWDELDLLLARARSIRLARAQDARRRVLVELEALGHDLDEAAEYPQEPLGDDLAAFQAGGPAESPFGAALSRLQAAIDELRAYDVAVRDHRAI